MSDKGSRMNKNAEINDFEAESGFARVTLVLKTVITADGKSF